MTAADFYDWASACARELDLLERRKEALRLPRSKVEGATRGPAAGDPTAAQAMQALSDEPGLQEGIDRCRRVLRKEAEVTNEVGRVLGTMASLALQLHYREGNGWQEIAYEFHISLSSMYRLRRLALEWVDAEGLVAAVGKS